jgi:hypothetical protein
MEEPNVLHTQNIAQWGKAPNPKNFLKQLTTMSLNWKKKTFLRKGMNKTFMQGKPS